MRESVLICARNSPDGVGGLAAYQRELAAALRGADIKPAFCSVHGKVDFDKSAYHLGTRTEEPHSNWMRLGGRPLLHPLLKRMIVHHFSGSTAYRKLADKSWNVIHYVGTGWDFAGFAMAALAKKCDAKFTIWPAVHPLVWGDDVVDIKLYQQADTVFCQSHNEAKHLIDRGLPKEKTTICGLPPMCQTDGDGTRLREKYSLGNRPAVFFLGRRDEGKGFPALLEAWRKVVKEVPDAVLLLAGPGDVITGNKSLCDLGKPDEKEKADAYSACDIFCLPSAHESFGIVYPEAWSYDKPVVCGTAPASREGIQDGITGLWTDGTTDDIARKLITLLKDAGLRKKMGKAGGDFQRSNLTWKSILAVHLAAFGIPLKSDA